MSMDSALIVKSLATKAISTLGNHLAPLAAYSTDFSDQVGSQRTAIVVPLITSAGTVLTDPTDFEQDDSTVGSSVVTMNHLVASFQLTNEELQNGQQLMVRAESRAQALAEKIKSKINAIITAANFTNTAETVAQSAFSTTNASNLWASLANGKKSLVLNNTGFSKILPSALTSFQLDASGKIPGLLGYDAVYVDNYTTGIGTNIYGFAAHTSGIAVASRIPSVADIGGLSSTIGTEIVTIPSLGISVLVKMWVKPGANSVWASYEVLFGAAKGQASGLTILKSS